MTQLESFMYIWMRPCRMVFDKVAWEILFLIAYLFEILRQGKNTGAGMLSELGSYVTNIIHRNYVVQASNNLLSTDLHYTDFGVCLGISSKFEVITNIPYGFRFFTKISSNFGENHKFSYEFVEIPEISLKLGDEL